MNGDDPGAGLEDVMARIREVVPLPPVQVPPESSASPVAPRDIGGRQWDSTTPGVRERHPFQVYVAGMNSDNDVATLAVAWGTIINDALDVTDAVTITGLDTPFTVANNDKIWIEASITSPTGVVTTAEMRSGNPVDEGWTSFPDPHAAGKWFHLIAQIRDFQGRFEGGTRPDSGEIPFVPEEDYIIAQLTNTNLVVAIDCIGLSMERIWHLKPWHGAVI